MGDSLSLYLSVSLFYSSYLQQTIVPPRRSLSQRKNLVRPFLRDALTDITSENILFRLDAIQDRNQKAVNIHT